MTKKTTIKTRRISLPYWNPTQRCLDERFMDIPTDLEGNALRKYVANLLSGQSSVASRQSPVDSQQSKKSRWEFVADGRNS